MLDDSEEIPELVVRNNCFARGWLRLDGFDQVKTLSSVKLSRHRSLNFAMAASDALATVMEILLN